MGPEAVAATDGRVARGERTRAAIVQALLDLLVEGDPTPTTAQIAERAGVSVRSLFGHFADTEALYRDLAREQAVRVTPLVEALERTGTLPQRIDALVAQRAELFETIAPVRHAIGTRAGRSEALQARLGEVAMVLRDQVSHQFVGRARRPRCRRRSTTARRARPVVLVRGLGPPPRGPGAEPPRRRRVAALHADCGARRRAQLRLSSRPPLAAGTGHPEMARAPSLCRLGGLPDWSPRATARGVETGVRRWSTLRNAWRTWCPVSGCSSATPSPRTTPTTSA